ncbi:hypothetical protein CRG98_005312 [Punica granatum]|uniref:Protein DA1-like domain-containing protein n=1 Tax=Punica granatum TaxID=22663 RepID=A0A2I0L0R0_PUNGR|nr:hypothetical protein CRG98_005312 [Punica granatum]
MGWLKNILKGASSSPTSNFKQECHNSYGDSEDESLSDKDHDEDNAVMGHYYFPYGESRHLEDQSQTEGNEGNDDAPTGGLYREVIEEELALGLQRSIRIENPNQQYGNIGNYIFQSYYSFPSTYSTWYQYRHNQMDEEKFINCTDTLPNLQESFQCNSSNPQSADYEVADEDHHPYFRPRCKWSYTPIVCDVCKYHVPVDSSGVPQYGEVPVFHQKYCTKHLHDGTAICFFCERLEVRGTRYSSYDDGRKICSDCKKSAIMNERDCQPLVDEILKFYEDLDMKVRQEFIPIFVLDKKKMNMIQTPKYGPKNNITGVKEEPFKLVSYKNVECIELLNGCPRLYIGRTLAHEMMHARLCLEGYQQSQKKHVQGFCGPLPYNIEEGMCQVMAHIWIKSKIHDMSRNESGSSPGLQFERKLAEHIKHSIETSDSPEYGDGFRFARRVVDKYGLKGTLNYVRMTGNFPETIPNFHAP